MTSEYTRVVNVSLNNIKDQVAAMMYAWGVVDDNETVVDMNLRDALNIDKEDIVQIEMKLKKEIEVTGTIKNGSGAS